jgi:hypothetical protein
VLIATSCEEDCDECFTPPAPFVFELVNETGENIFTIKSFNQNQLTIIQNSTNQFIEYQFISENDLNLIEINSIGWTTEQVELSFQLDDFEIFSFSVNAKVETEDCCTFTRYSNISIDGADFEPGEESGIYRVTID